MEKLLDDKERCRQWRVERDGQSGPGAGGDERPGLGDESLGGIAEETPDGAPHLHGRSFAAECQTAADTQAPPTNFTGRIHASAGRR